MCAKFSREIMKKNWKDRENGKGIKMSKKEREGEKDRERERDEEKNKEIKRANNVETKHKVCCCLKILFSTLKCNLDALEIPSHA